MAITITLALCFVAFVAMNAARVVLTLYALTLGAPASSVGVLGGMFYLFPLLLSWPIGAAADRVHPRTLLFIGASCGCVSLLIPYFVPHLAVFYGAAALMGLAIAFYHVTLQNLVGTLSTPERRTRNFSNFSMVGATTNFVGPLIAGFAIDNFGYAVGCLSVVAISSTAFVLIGLGGRRLPDPVRKTSSAVATPQEMPADPGVWRMLAASAAVQLGTDIFQFYIPIYGHERNMSASAIGSVLAAFAVASFAVRIFLPRLVREVSADRLLAYSFYVGAIGFTIVPFFDHAVIVAFAAFVFGIGMGTGTPLTLMLMFDRSSVGRSGRMLGIRLTTINVVRVFAPMVFGAIGTAFGAPAVFWINAAAMTAGGVMSRRAVKTPTG